MGNDSQSICFRLEISQQAYHDGLLQTLSENVQNQIKQTWYVLVPPTSAAFGDKTTCCESLKLPENENDEGANNYKFRKRRRSTQYKISYRKWYKLHNLHVMFWCAWCVAIQAPEDCFPDNAGPPAKRCDNTDGRQYVRLVVHRSVKNNNRLVLAALWATTTTRVDYV